MKRILAVFLLIFMLFSLVGCSHSEKQNALLRYINETTATMATLENQLLESYGSVTGENYKNDAATYAELNGQTIVLARQLNDEAVTIASTLTDSEILEVHRLYVNYSNKMLSAISMMISAIKNQSSAEVSVANEKLNEANNLALDYQLELRKLAEKYDIEFKD